MQRDILKTLQINRNEIQKNLRNSQEDRKMKTKMKQRANKKQISKQNNAADLNLNI